MWSSSGTLYRALKIGLSSEIERLLRLSRFGCAEEIGNRGDFAQIIGLQSNGKAGVVADHAIHGEAGLQQMNRALRQSDLLVRARGGCVELSFDGHAGRD